MLDQAASILIHACLGAAAAALALFALREASLRWRARRLQRRVRHLRDFLAELEREHVVGQGGLRERFGAARDLEALEQLLEERRAHLTSETPPAEAAALYASYDELGVVERHLHRLQHARRWQERAFAARFLGEIGSARAVLPLIAVMRDTREEDRDVRMAASRALGRIRDPRALGPLLEMLGAPESWLPARIAEVVLQFGEAACEPLVQQLGRRDDAGARAWAAEILGDLGNAKAAPALVACLTDLNDQVRARAASALGKLHDRRSVPELLRIMLGDPVPYVRIQAVRALGAIGDPRALHHLIDALKDGEWWVRIRVVEALEQLGEQAVEPLFLALEDQDPEVRGRAAMTLESLGVLDRLVERLPEGDLATRKKLLVAGQAGVVEILVEALRHADTRVRFIVTEILGEVRHTAVPPALVARLGDEEEPLVRAAAVRSLAQLQAESAAEPISRLLGDPEDTIRVEAVRALERIPVADPHLLLSSAVRDPEPRVRAGAAVVLGKVGDERAVPALLGLLGDGDATVRAEAARALGLLRATEAIGRLMEAFHDYDSQVQCAAARALGQVGSPECLETLVRGLENASPELGGGIAWALGQIRWPDPERLIDVLFQGADRSSRLGALAAIGQLGHAAGRELMRSMLSDADEEVVCAAIRTLGELQDGEALADLQALLRSPSEAVREKVLDALCRLRDPASLPAVRQAVFDTTPRVRARAVLALAHLQDREAGDLLRGVLASERSTPEMLAHALLGLMTLDRDQDLAAVLEALGTIPLYDFVHAKDRLADPILYETVETVRAGRSIEFMVASVKSRRDLEEALGRELSLAHGERRRVKVIRTLAFLKSEAAYPAVWRSFYKDPSEDVRITALQYLVSMASGEDFFRLVTDALADLQPRVRAEAMRRLRDVPSERALPLFMTHLDSDEPELQDVLVDFLAGLPGSKLEEFLDGVLGAELGLHAREVVIRVLGRTRHRDAAPLLATFLEAEEPELRRAAVRTLGELPDKRAHPLLESCLQDPDLEVRRSALAGASGLGASTAAPLLRKGLDDPAPELRCLAILGLARLRTRDAHADYRALTRDPASGVRAAALAALASEGSEPVEDWTAPKDVPAIAAALRDLGSAEHFEKKLGASRLVGERIGALKVLFFRDARSRAQALAMARLDPSPRVRAAGARLEEVLSAWLMQPDAERWLGVLELPALQSAALAPDGAALAAPAPDGGTNGPEAPNRAHLRVV